MIKNIYVYFFIILLCLPSCTKDEDNVFFEINLIDTYPTEIVEFQENIYVKLSYQHTEGYLGFSNPDYLSLVHTL